MNSLSPKQRTLLLGLGLFALFSLLVLQFFRIQVIERQKWNKKAHAQHYFTITEPAVRGTFWANTAVKKGHPETPQKLAVDIRKYHLYIDPKSLPQECKKEIAGNLLQLSTPSELELKRFMVQFNKQSRSRKLVSWMDEDKKKSICDWWYPYAKAHKIASNAVFFVPDHLRSHPFGKLLGQVLHTVQMQKDEKTTKALPTGGLELSCNKYLAGSSGKRRLMRSPRHSMELQQVIIQPEHGADVYLTVNPVLQAICEEELEKGLKACGAKAAWAIVMEPNSGEILALAQYPYFFPDQYPLYFARPELMEHAKIKAITDANEPGSVMKPITIAIALQANLERKKQGKPALFHPSDKIDTSRGNFPGRGKKPLKDTHFHHYLNMNLALQKSSNIYCATLVQRIIQNFGDNWYRDQLQNRFGFGQKTKLELPGESLGVLPTPGKTHPNGRLEWSVPTPYSLAMGHNVQATSLQMTRAFAVFANGGYLVKPTLIKKVVKTNQDGTTEVLVDNSIREELPQVLEPEVIAEVVKGMKYVTKPGGAAVIGDIYGYTEVGKTGTTEKIVGGKYTDRCHFSSFVGFTPVTKPAFVIFVGMDEPKVGFVPGKGLNHRGSICCAPVFREIGRRMLEYLGVPPDDPGGYPKSDPRYNPNTADWFKETQEAQLLYDQWNGKRH